MKENDVAGLILAAGESSRMGQDKALLDYRGQTFLATIIDNLREAGLTEIGVVLGYHADLIRATVDLGAVRVVLNADYKRGQTSSLQAGLGAWDEPGPRAVLLCLVDHPAVGAPVIRKILDHYRQSSVPVIIPVFNGKRGHPVLIGREVFAELRALAAGEGANTVVRKHRSDTGFAPVDDPAILMDVDDLEAYDRLTGC